MAEPGESWGLLSQQEREYRIRRAAQVQVDNEDMLAMMKAIDRMWGRQPWMLVHHPLDELQDLPRIPTPEEQAIYKDAYRKAREGSFFPPPPPPTPEQQAKMAEFLKDALHVMEEIHHQRLASLVKQARKDALRGLFIDPPLPKDRHL